MSGPEARLESRLVVRAREAGGLALKWVAPGTTGVPDRIVLMPQGRIVFVEMKAPGKSPTALQEAMHKKLRALGMDVRVIDSREGIDELFS